MAVVSEEEFLNACPRRGPAWECYRDAKRDGKHAILIVDGNEVMAIRVDPPNGISLTWKRR